MFGPHLFLHERCMCFLSQPSISVLAQSQCDTRSVINLENVFHWMEMFWFHREDIKASDLSVPLCWFAQLTATSVQENLIMLILIF